LPTDRPAPPGTDLEQDPAERERDVFAMSEMVAAFDIDRVNPNPARFDLKKCTAINADWIRAIPLPDLTGRIQSQLVRDGVLAEPVSEEDRDILEAAVPLVRERMETLGQADGMLGFLFTDEVRFAPDPDDAARMLGPDAAPTLAAGRAALAGLDSWTAAEIEAALRAALVDGLGLKPKLAFGPLRVAVTGRRVSPPLFESLELLGRDRTLARVDAALG
jgi:glutamyl-tRNA synthetase